MGTDPLERAEELFQAALSLAPGEREDYLAAACGEDHALLAELRSLLAAHEAAGSFIDTPAVELVPEFAGDRRASARVGQTIGSFRITKLVGSGGMGTVYEAEQGQPRRTVALKMMRAGMSSHSALRRFLVEAEILARLHHPSIAQVYEAGMHVDGDESVPYFAMELVPGARTLLAYAVEKQLSTRESLALFARICDAVQHGHQKGIIHRDLKPSNILVDSSGVPKVIDFGVARATDADEAVTTIGTDVRRLIGTVQYMSPEAFVGDPHELDTRSDVYSLGVVLYELLTGRLPHDVGTSSLPEAARVVQQEPPQRPSRIRRGLRGDLETIILKALEKERERRYSSASALARDVERYLRNEPIEARPPSAVYQLRKFVARNRAASTLFAVLLAALVFFGIAMAHLARQARAEAEVAEQITDFMVDLFAYASPGFSAGEDIPVRFVLDQGQRRIERELRDQPVVRVRLLDVLGHSYHWLGSYEIAERLFREVHALREDLRGANDAETLHSKIDVAGVLNDRGEYAQAERLLQEVYRTLSEERGWKDPHLAAYCLHRLGSTLKNLDRHEQAEQVLRQAVELRGGLGPRFEADFSQCLNSLAGLLLETNRSEEALGLFEEALAIYLRLRPEGDPRIPIYRQNISRGLTALGDYEGALQQSRLALEEGERILSREHPYYAEILVGHAHVLSILGRYNEAEVGLRRALEIQQESLNPDHPEIAFTCNDLGGTLHHLGRYTEAEAFARRAVGIWRRTYPEAHTHTAIALINLAKALSGGGELQEAERLAREGLAMHDAMDPEGPEVGLGLGMLSWILILQGRLTEAEDVATAAVSNLERWPEEIVELGGAHNRLALIHNRRGAPSSAEEACRQALECLRRTLPGDHPFLCYTLYQRGWARYQRGDREGAEASMRESIAMFRRLFPDGHPDLAWPLNHLGEIVLLENPDEAVKLLEEALELRRKQGTAAHWLSVTLINLGAAYQRSGDDERARPLLEEAIQIRTEHFRSPDADLANALSAAALVYASREDYETAALYAADCLEEHRRLHPAGHLNRARVQSLLGEMKARLAEFEEAEALLLEAYEALLALPAEKAILRETLERLVLLYELAERPGEVEGFRAELTALERP